MEKALLLHSADLLQDTPLPLCPCTLDRVGLLGRSGLGPAGRWPDYPGSDAPGGTSMCLSCSLSEVSALTHPLWESILIMPRVPPDQREEAVRTVMLKIQVLASDDLGLTVYLGPPSVASFGISGPWAPGAVYPRAPHSAQHG